MLFPMSTLLHLSASLTHPLPDVAVRMPDCERGPSARGLHARGHLLVTLLAPCMTTPTARAKVGEEVACLRGLVSGSSQERQCACMDSVRDRLLRHAGTDLVKRLLGDDAPSCFGLTFPLLVRICTSLQALPPLQRLRPFRAEPGSPMRSPLPACMLAEPSMRMRKGVLRAAFQLWRRSKAVPAGGL